MKWCSENMSWTFFILTDETFDICWPCTLDRTGEYVRWTACKVLFCERKAYFYFSNKEHIFILYLGSDVTYNFLWKLHFDSFRMIYPKENLTEDEYPLSSTLSKSFTRLGGYAFPRCHWEFKANNCNLVNSKFKKKELSCSNIHYWTFHMLGEV